MTHKNRKTHKLIRRLELHLKHLCKPPWKVKTSVNQVGTSWEGLKQAFSGKSVILLHQPKGCFPLGKKGLGLSNTVYLQRTSRAFLFYHLRAALPLRPRDTSPKRSGLQRPQKDQWRKVLLLFHTETKMMRSRLCWTVVNLFHILTQRAVNDHLCRNCQATEQSIGWDLILKLAVIKGPFKR